MSPLFADFGADLWFGAELKMFFRLLQIAVLLILFNVARAIYFQPKFYLNPSTKYRSYGDQFLVVSYRLSAHSLLHKYLSTSLQ